MKTFKRPLAAALDPIKLFQTLLTHLLLLLGCGLLTRGEWGPAFFVFAVYVVTLIVIAVCPASTES